MKATKVTLRFNLSKDTDRRAYEILQNTEASYSRAIISALNCYLDACEKQEKEDTFIQRVMDTIRRELRAASPMAGLLQLIQPNFPEPPKPNQEDEDTVMAFLDAF